ncbi:MoeA2 [Desulfamplus magnetovallimortis]|uniref:Molybdopterin molybdenumtransferase n=1 Tax=Desulfamplus magnetovallimortis TaxID=1246637 RepID=A0A1W1HGN6_9BACT|nr:molybdopterin biosynthesis protein [Desulfamplus magnetovallimortis]SLM31542.1 MoeA2 [Desulfamplus magnetovallimortis]
MKRNVYLNMKSIEAARQIMFDQFPGADESGAEDIDSVDALGRILAEPAVAALSAPNYHAAAMDGIALDAKLSFGASDDEPKILVSGKDAFWINTGHVMPEGTNAVIMIEHLNVIDSVKNGSSNGSSIEINSPAFPWQNVRKMGEDIVATELIFPRGHKITSYSLGALIAGGVFRVSVKKKPKVLIIPTGSELKSWQYANDNGLKPGDVIDSNSWVLGALCVEYGASFESHAIIHDEIEIIMDAVREATLSSYDMVFIIGGSSAGSKDYAKPVIDSLGEVFVHGVTMMPGKPLLFGKVNEKPVFGIPGYPVSAVVAFEQFAGPLLLKMHGLNPAAKQRETIDVVPARKIASKLGVEEFLRVKIGSVDGRFMASQLPRGAGSITTLTEADGIIRIPPHVEGIAEKEIVKAELIRPLAAIEDTVVITGSHDNTLDLLADQICRTRPGVTISSSHVGSMGGLMAIRKKTCHVAGSHLLDPEDGSYNISYIKKYLPGERVWLVNLVMREQGLIVAGGNPEKIKGLDDLKKKELVFINRQGGAGTRVLLDYKLKELGMTPADIRGYENEEYTHMSVAVAVLSGRADAGMGIYAAAKALSLDFIPVFTESYDLVIPDRFFHTEKIQVLLETIKTNDFKKRVGELGGYGTETTGEAILLES